MKQKIPQCALPEGRDTCLGYLPMHTQRMRWRDCCRDRQAGVKDKEEKPCLLLCPCSNLNRISKHAAPCTAYNTTLCEVENCRRREGSRTGVYSNKDLREVMLQP